MEQARMLLARLALVRCFTEIEGEVSFSTLPERADACCYHAPS